MGSFKDKQKRFLVIDHSEDYSFVACQSGEEVGFFVKSRKLKPDYFWVLNLSDCIIFHERLFFGQDYQFKNFTKSSSNRNA
ncbi:MAG: hypothetical protein HQL09_09865 [Nitrospirae bacterium]|nr:hypothetical protein [Nitrospirota bacterium]